MADKKISALTAATTPLAGTEVLPIVQSGSTVKVSVDNLTTGKAVTALSYVSTVATGTAPFTVSSSTNVPNLNASLLNGATFSAPGTIGDGTASPATFTTATLSGTGYVLSGTAASTLRKAGSFGNTGGTLDFGVESSSGGALFTNAGAYTGNIGTAGNTDFNLCSNGTVRATVKTDGNFSLSNGNLVIGTSGKGIDFSAAGGDVLTQYEEATFTATLTGCTTAPTSTATVTKVGRLVTVNIPALFGTSNATSKTITGLPAQFRPAGQQRGFFAQVTDNGGSPTIGSVFVEADGTIYVFAGAANNAWTASGDCVIQTLNLTFQYNV